jgi:hypothetical protein
VNLKGESKNFKMLELTVPLNIFFRKKALGKGKVKIHPRTCHEGPEAE